MFIKQDNRYVTTGYSKTRYLDISLKVVAKGKKITPTQQANHISYLCKNNKYRNIHFNFDNNVATFTSSKKYGNYVAVEPGYYTYNPGGFGSKPSLNFQKKRVTSENYFIKDQYKDTLDYITSFLDSKEYYIENDLTYKLGLLLYGPPGNGKTSLIRYLMKNEFKDFICINTSNIIDNKTLEALQEQEKMKVIIIEEITTGDISRDLGELLRMLDGESTLNNTIIIATTNYPEMLPSNIVDRPGRFDKIIKIGNPNNEAKTDLLLNYFKIDESEIEYILENTEDYSIAHIKEMVLLSKVHKLTYADAIDKIKTHKEFIKNSFAEPKAKIGIF